MTDTTLFSPRERTLLWIFAALGGVLLNGLFVYGALARPGAFAAALANPIALAFLLEALLMLVLLAWWLPRWGVLGTSRTAFVVLALLGGLAFALPAALLWRRR